MRGLTTLLFLLAFALTAAPYQYQQRALLGLADTDTHEFKGSAIYPDFFEIKVHPAQGTLPPPKQYLFSIVQALFRDYLSVIREAQIPNPQPIAIAYPFPRSTAEDPLPMFSPAHQTKVHYPLRVVHDDRQIVFSEAISGTVKLAPQAFHLVYSLEMTPEKTYVLHSVFFWEETKLLQSREEFNEAETLEKVMGICRDIRANLSGENVGGLNVLGEPSRISVYVNDVFFGKTPLIVDHLAVGNYTLVLRKEGYADERKSIDIQKDNQVTIKAELKKPEGIGTLEVITSPPGAQLYLGASFAGKTPVKLENLPPGISRLHLTMPGYVDEFRNISISNEDSQQLWRLKLQQGAPQGYYRPDAAVLGPLRWYDFFIGSTVLGGALAGGAIYFSVQRDNTRDSMLTSLSTSNRQLFTPADQQLYNSKTTQMDRYNRYSDYAIVGGVISFSFALYSFYRHLSSFDMNVSTAHTQNTTMVGWGVDVSAYEGSFSVGTSFQF